MANDKRLIDADIVINDLEAMKNVIGYDSILIDAMVDGLKRQPQVDAVEVVRCKDCKYRHSSEECECRLPDAYCSDGERRI